MPVFFYQQTGHPRQIIILYQTSSKTFVITLDLFTQLPDFQAVFPTLDQALIFVGVNYGESKFLLQSDLLFGVERDGNYSRYLVAQAEAQQPDLFRLQKLQFISFKAVFAHSSAQAILYQHTAESCLFASSSGFFGPKFPVNLQMQRPFENLGIFICSDLLIGHVTPNMAILRQPNLAISFIEYQFSSSGMQQIWTNIHLSEAQVSAEQFQQTQNTGQREKTLSDNGLPADDSGNSQRPESQPNTARSTSQSLFSDLLSQINKIQKPDMSEYTFQGQADANPPPLPSSQLFQFMAKLSEQFGFGTPVHIRCLDERMLRLAVETAQLAGFVVTPRSGQLTINLVARSYLELEFNNNYQFLLKQSSCALPIKFIDITAQFQGQTRLLDLKFQVSQGFKRRVFAAFCTASISQLVVSAQQLEMNFLRLYAGYSLSDLEIVFQGHFNFCKQKFVKFDSAAKLVRILVVDSTNSDDYFVEGIGEQSNDLFQSIAFASSREGVQEIANQVLPMPFDSCKLSSEFLCFDKQFKSKETNYAKQRTQQFQKVLLELQRINQQKLFNQYSENWDFLQKSEMLIQPCERSSNQQKTTINIDQMIAQLSNNVIIPTTTLASCETPFDEKIHHYYGVFILQTSQLNADKLFTQKPNQFSFTCAAASFEILIATYYNYIFIRPEGLEHTTLRVFHNNAEIVPQDDSFSISLISSPIRLCFESQDGAIQVNRLMLKTGFYSPGSDQEPELLLFQPLMRASHTKQAQAIEKTPLKCQQIVQNGQIFVKFRQFSDIRSFKIKASGQLCLKVYVKQPVHADYASGLVQLFKDTSCQLNSGLDDRDLHVLHVLESGEYSIRISSCVRLVVVGVGAEIAELQWFGDPSK